MRVRMLQSRLVGARHPAVGEVLDLPDARAKHLIKSGVAAAAPNAELTETTALPDSIDETADLAGGKRRKGK